VTSHRADIAAIVRPIIGDMERRVLDPMEEHTAR
jgi:hypothetical protein